MTKHLRNHLSDLHGASLLAIDATAGVTGIIEALHTEITRLPTALAGPVVAGASDGIAALIYSSIRGVARAVGVSLDLIVPRVAPLLGHVEPSPARDALVSALNGVLGDHLADTGNPLAIPMRLRREGRAIEMSRLGVEAAVPLPGPKVVVMVHGLCMSDLGWVRRRHDHGAAIERRTGRTALYLHYNSGRHISTNGRQLAATLEELVDAWPVPIEDIALVGHSMGGLVARSACHYGATAGHDWVRALRSVVTLGTPHHGAPLERGGHWLHVVVERSPLVAPLSRLGRIRSAGITDLRHGAILDDDWNAHDRFAHGRDTRRPTPLPEGVRCTAIAATTGRAKGDLSDRLLGDGLVPLWSALGRHRNRAFALGFAPENQWIAHETGHLELLERRDVCDRICAAL